MVFLVCFVLLGLWGLTAYVIYRKQSAEKSWVLILGASFLIVTTTLGVGGTIILKISELGDPVVQRRSKLENLRGNALTIAKYDVMGKILKNPTSAKFSNEKIHDSYSVDRTEDGVSSTYYRFLISFDVVAENSFGGRIMQGYCTVLSLTESGKQFIVLVEPQSCTRNGPTAEELNIMKALASWDNQQSNIKN